MSSASSHRLARFRSALAVALSVLRELGRQHLRGLIPLVLLLFVLALLLAFFSAAGPLAPFVYPLF